MPVVRVDIIGPKDAAYCSAVLRCVRAAVVGGLGAPDERVTVRVVQTPAELTDMPATRTDRFTVVDVMLYAGRTPEAKAACSTMMRTGLETDLGIPSCEVTIAYHDMAPTDLDVLPGEALAQ